MSAPKIEAYSFGMMIISGVKYSHDVIVLPDRVIGNWRRRTGHTLIPDDILSVFEASPEILIVGTGSFDRMQISDAVIQETNKRGVQLISKPTGKAWLVYNEKVNENRVAAAFHLTC